MGKGAVKEIESILRDEKFDPVGVADKIQQQFKDTSTFLDTANTLKTGLAKFASREEVSLKENEAILKIMFTAATSVESIVDLNQWVDRWQKIIRAFGMVAGVPPDSARVVYIQRSSPLVVEVATNLVVVLAVGQAASFVLDQIERYLRIRKEALEVANLKLRNKKLAQEIEKEAELYKHETSAEIATKVISQIDKKKEKDGEVVTAVTMSIENLFVFLDKGGKLDYFLPEKKEEEAGAKGPAAKERANLEEVFRKVRRLETKFDEIRALPNPGKEEGN